MHKPAEDILGGKPFFSGLKKPGASLEKCTKPTPTSPAKTNGKRKIRSNLSSTGPKPMSARAYPGEKKTEDLFQTVWTLSTHGIHAEKIGKINVSRMGHLEFGGLLAIGLSGSMDRPNDQPARFASLIDAELGPDRAMVGQIHRLLDRQAQFTDQIDHA